LLTSSWGTPFKTAAFLGNLCFGPSQGRNVTYVRPSTWIGQWQNVEPYAALQEIARRYLRSYGPGRPETFARWWWGGSGITQAKKLFQSIAQELEEVEVEGWQGYALQDTIAEMEASEAKGVVRLVPLFDAYTLTLGKDMGPVIPPEHLSRVFRPQGWITATVLVDGTIQGVWEYKARKSATTINIRMFSPPKKWIKKGVEAEAERLGQYWNTKVVLEWEIV
ncbi:MAG: crosslink repair DNA glycosylase YcaQ family protein, partial [Candidatus Promineifilaceae bacterium]